MERATTIRLSGIALLCLSIVIGGAILFGARPNRPPEIREQDYYRFPDVFGPSHVTVVPPKVPASWRAYGEGSQSRLAILLTDPDSSWLGLAHGLKSIGIPFRITRDVHEALAHQVVLVYPTISGKVPTPDALQALAEFPQRGGTLIGVQVLGGELNQVFGFREAVASRQRYDLQLTSTDPLLAELTDPSERQLRIGVRAVTLGTVPFGKFLSVMLTHDVDFTHYAAYEHSQGLVGTYFIQVKYIRDYNDDIFSTTRGYAISGALQNWEWSWGATRSPIQRSLVGFPWGRAARPILPMSHL